MRTHRKMAEAREWCSNQISKLLEEDLRVPTLTEIKQHFSSVSPEEAKVTANNLQLTAIFDCLNNSNVEQVDLACDVLSTCMSHLTLGNSIDLYSTLLERALRHPYSSVKIMALKEIERNVEDVKELLKLFIDTQLLKSVISIIADQDLTVAKIATVIVHKVGVTNVGIQILISEEMLPIIYEVMATNEIVSLRVNELFVDISKSSPSSMKELASQGLLLPLLKGLDDNDVLLKMNIIEILSQLVITEHGYLYLKNNEIISKILKNCNSRDIATVELCEPGILRFFGSLARWKPSETIANNRSVVNRIFNIIQNFEPTIIGVAFDTLGYIGETNEGKYSLETADDSMTLTLKAIGDQIQTYPMEIKLRALNCLENLFKIEDFESKITNLVRKWYYSMGSDSMSWLYNNFANNPFNEIRVAALGVLFSLSNHNWAQEMFKNTPGFVEFLLDRRAENFKECKEYKYAIVKNLSGSVVFDQNTQKRFQEYIKEGPFYVQAVTEVAIEGD
ncbi:hypothetical protein FQA39_LY17137 [Lamprigera yunnana]|nr:hypothetical protein FQA39_LY17137 [Lamprigera yunnana]